jgi:hypothetical protein
MVGEGLEPSDRVVNLVHYSFSLSLYMSCHKRWLANGDSSDEEAARGGGRGGGGGGDVDAADGDLGGFAVRAVGEVILESEAC